MPSPGCVNGLQTNVFIFNTSRHVHISVQAWKGRQGPWSLTHSLPVTLPSAICGIWNDSAWNLHAGSWVFAAVRHIQMKRISCHWALALELCLRDVLIIIFFSFAGYLPICHCEEKSHYSCKKCKGPLQSGLNRFLQPRVDFCITEKNTVGRIVHWKTVIIYRPPLTVARDSLPAAQTLTPPLKISVAPSFYIL